MNFERPGCPWKQNNPYPRCCKREGKRICQLRAISQKIWTCVGLPPNCAQTAEWKAAENRINVCQDRYCHSTPPPHSQCFAQWHFFHLTPSWVSGKIKMALRERFHGYYEPTNFAECTCHVANNAFHQMLQAATSPGSLSCPTGDNTDKKAILLWITEFSPDTMWSRRVHASIFLTAFRVVYNKIMKVHRAQGVEHNVCSKYNA